MSDHQVFYKDTGDDNPYEIPIGTSSNKQVSTATVSDAERPVIRQPTTSRTIRDGKYLDFSAPVATVESSTQQPPASTGNFGPVQKYPTKPNARSFKIVYLILIGAGIIASIALLTTLLVQLSSHVADRHDDAIMNAVLNNTAMIAQDVGILRNEIFLKEECPPDSFIGHDRNCYFALMDTNYIKYTNAEKACRQFKSFPAYIESDLMYNGIVVYLRPRVVAVGLQWLDFWLGQIYDLDSGKIYLMDGRENTWEQKWVPGFPHSNSGSTQLLISVQQDPDHNRTGILNYPPSVHWSPGHFYVLCQRPW